MQRLYPLWIAGILLPFVFGRIQTAWPPVVVVVYDVNNLFGIAAFLLLYRTPGAARKNSQPSHAYRAVAWIGLYSYGIYLWHIAMVEPVMRIASHWHVSPVSISVGLVAALAGTAAGIATTELIELPMLRVRDRVFPRRIPSPLEVGVEETSHL